MTAATAALALVSHGKAPSEAFLRVLRVLAEHEDGDYNLQLARRADVERIVCMRILHRMVRLGIAYRWHEDGDPRELKRGLRVYYRLTVAGRELAEQIMTGVAP